MSAGPYRSHLEQIRKIISRNLPHNTNLTKYAYASRRLVCALVLDKDSIQTGC